MKYLAIDADRVGETFERFVACGDEAGASAFSVEICSRIEALRGSFGGMGAQVLAVTGDGLLISNYEGDIEDVIALCGEWHPEITLSIGIGYDPVSAYIALKLAKCRGKSRCVEVRRIDFSEVVIREA